jgi:hypothetical protein
MYQTHTARGPHDRRIQRDKLAATVSARRAEVQKYLTETRSSISRWATTSLICSAIAAVLTGGPALGGQQFTTTVQASLSLSDTAPVWQPLCVGALVVSLLAAIATQLCRSREASGRIAIAEAANGTLEGLLIDLNCTDLTTDHALSRYRQVADKIGFV